MDDLSGFTWSSSQTASQNNEPSGPKGNYYPTLRPTPPISGRSTPLSQLPTGNQKPLSNVPSGSKSSTPGNDSFANLVSFNAGQASKNLSLQEQQRLLQEQKQKQEEERRKQFDRQFAPQPINPALWDTLGSGRSTPSQSVAAPPSTNGDDDDILAAFNASAPVDASSHMPPPSRTESQDQFMKPMVQPLGKNTSTSNGIQSEELDDDPFGLGMSTVSKSKASSNKTTNGIVQVEDSEDVLGLLGRPVSEFPKTQPKKEPYEEASPKKAESPKDRAIAELIDMGFPPEKSRLALAATDSGLDVQAAVGLLLNQAHEESKSKGHTSRNRGSEREGPRGAETSRKAPVRRTSSNSSAAKPAWMKEQGGSSGAQRRNDSSLPAHGEKDTSQYASEFGNNLFKTANSLWKTSTKKINKAVSEFNSESDPNQPKWMRESQPESGVRKSRSQARDQNAGDQERPGNQEKSKPEAPPITDEALLLEGDGGRPQRKTTSRAPITKSSPILAGLPSKSSNVPLSEAREAQKLPKFVQQSQERDPRSRLTRQAVEEENAQVYISPARRKKVAPKVTPQENEPDLIFNDTQSNTVKPVPPTRISNQPTRPLASNSLPSRPSPPKRSIPPISPSAIQSSVSSRQAGTAAFKRGDYAEATTHYTSALRALPPTHPLTIPLLTNRSLSHLKTGDPKASIADANSTIDLIGASRGSGETIDLNGGEGIKPMEPYWGKAMMRKAESLEQLEKWADAAEVWGSCVAAGVGGGTSISGRNRCENAARPKPASKPPPKKIPPRPRPSALSDLTSASGESGEAVTRLRAANAAADKLDDEKFALADVVDGRVSSWRAGKETNLRALLASLENVLWPDAGWKKVGMGELIQSNKVKIVYMKGIAKVHPDKLPTTATTEHKMISAAVFATLNEAWEKFKTENNM